MHKRVTAVVDDEVLRPREALGLPNGSEVEIVVRPLPTIEESPTRVQAFERAMGAIQASMAEHPDEWTAMREELETR